MTAWCVAGVCEGSVHGMDLLVDKLLVDALCMMPWLRQLWFNRCV